MKTEKGNILKRYQGPKGRGAGFPLDSRGGEESLEKGGGSLQKKGKALDA